MRPEVSTGRRRPGLSALSAVLLTLAGLAVVLAPIAWWARDVALDTDTFTATVAPLAGDPALQAELIALAVRTVDDQVDFVEILDGRVPAVVATTVGGELNDRLAAEVTERVGNLVRSDGFAQIWSGIVRAAHERTLAFVRHEGTALDHDDSGTITLDLRPLVDRGLQAVRELPVPDEVALVIGQVLPDVSDLPTTVVVTRVEWLPTVVDRLALLDGVAGWIGWAAAGLTAAGLALARRRLRAAAVLCAGIALGWLVVRIGWSIAVSGLWERDPLLWRTVANVVAGPSGSLWVYPVVAAAAAGVLWWRSTAPRPESTTSRQS